MQQELKWSWGLHELKIFQPEQTVCAYLKTYRDERVERLTRKDRKTLSFLLSSEINQRLNWTQTHRNTAPTMLYTVVNVCTASALAVWSIGCLKRGNIHFNFCVNTPLNMQNDQNGPLCCLALNVSQATAAMTIPFCSDPMDFYLPLLFISPQFTLGWWRNSDPDRVRMEQADR